MNLSTKSGPTGVERITENPNSTACDDGARVLSGAADVTRIYTLKMYVLAHKAFAYLRSNAIVLRLLHATRHHSLPLHLPAAIHALTLAQPRSHKWTHNSVAYRDQQEAGILRYGRAVGKTRSHVQCDSVDNLHNNGQELFNGKPQLSRQSLEQDTFFPFGDHDSNCFEPCHSLRIHGPHCVDSSH